MPRSHSSWLLLAAVALLVPRVAPAVDGVIEINQAAALAGGITAGDAPGFPVTLTAPGSYRLTGGLVVPDGATTAILIDASEVAIDLNGFSITCADPCPGSSGFGIDSVLVPENFGASVRNGTIRGMGTAGLRLVGRSVVEDVVVVGNGGSGILVVGGRAIVRGCLAEQNTGDGIHVAAKSVVEGNTAFENTGAGIFAEFGSTVSGNSAVDNGDAGIQCGANCNVFRNSAVQNGVGIQGTGTFSDNTITDNTGFGLSIGPTDGYGGNVLRGNNSGGDQVSAGLQIGTNVCSSNTTCP